MNKNQDENKIIAIIVLVSGHFRIFICYFSEINPPNVKVSNEARGRNITLEERKTQKAP